MAANNKQQCDRRKKKTFNESLQTMTHESNQCREDRGGAATHTGTLFDRQTDIDRYTQTGIDIQIQIEA